MKKLKCCIVDDEPLAANLLAGYIEKTPSLELTGVFTSAEEAVRHVLCADIDIAYLDINMPQLNGLEFARIIPQHVSIVFTTAYDSYALQSYRAGAADYLLKPISYEDFLDSANKLGRLRGQITRDGINANRRYIIVKSEYKLVQIDVNDILYIEGLKDYVKIVLDKEDRTIMTLMNLKSFEKSLPADQFLRVHRSYIINSHKIKLIDRNRVVFGKTYIPISETYKQSFSDYLNRHSV